MDAHGLTARICLALAAAGLLSGCASPIPEENFDSVQTLVFHRTGQRVRWNRQSGDDRQASQAVDQLLQKPLNSQSAVQIALLNNHDLQAVYEDVGVAQADLVQAGLLKNPVFSGAFEPADGGAGIKLQMSVMEDFLDILQIPMRKRIAAADLRVADLLVSKAVIDKVSQVRAAFFAQQAADDLLALQQSIAQANADAMDLATRLHDAGNIPDLDFFNRQAVNEKAQLDLADAQADADEAREELNELLGLTGEQIHWTIADPLPALPPPAPTTQPIETLAIQNNFDLLATKWRIKSAAVELGIQKDFGPLTELDLGASTEEEVHGPWETGPAISFPIPIFDFGQAARAKARSELARQRETYLAQAARIGAHTRRAAAMLAAAEYRARRLNQILLPLARRIVQETQLHYNGMLAGPFELLSAKQNEIETAAREVQARRDFWIDSVKMDQLITGGDGGT